MSIDRHLAADRNSVNAIACSFAHVRIITERFCLSIQPSIIRRNKCSPRKPSYGQSARV